MERMTMEMERMRVSLKSRVKYWKTFDEEEEKECTYFPN